MEEQRRGRAKFKNFILVVMFCQYCSILFSLWDKLPQSGLQHLQSQLSALFITLYRAAEVIMWLS